MRMDGDRSGTLGSRMRFTLAVLAALALTVGLSTAVDLPVLSPDRPAAAVEPSPRTDPSCEPFAPPESEPLDQALEPEDLAALAGTAPSYPQREPEQSTAAESGLGFERWLHYAGADTGAGSTLAVNQATGNTVFAYNPFAHPGRGVSTFLRITHNSHGRHDSPLGTGWAIAPSTVTALGTGLIEMDGSDSGMPLRVDMVDGDGTRHSWRLNRNDSRDSADWTYDRPPGVHLDLARTETGWRMLAPDRTEFEFDGEGRQTATVDKNGNRLSFVYQRLGRTQVLTELIDPSGRRTLSLDYWRPGDAAQVRTGNQWGTDSVDDLPGLVGRLKRATDAEGRAVAFDYTRDGVLARIVDGAGTDLAKSFEFGYTDTISAYGVLIGTVTDPLGQTTAIRYDKERRAIALVDRRGSATQIRYGDHTTTVTDPLGADTVTTFDEHGRAVAARDALGGTAGLTWDADHNVTELTDQLGNTTAWTYDGFTGLPLTILDPENAAAGGEPTRLRYEFSRDGHVADLVGRSTPGGREWRFTTDERGNVVKTEDPAGFATRYEYDDYGLPTSATDPRGATTRYGDFDANGFPRRITDPFGCDTYYFYDETGDVTRVVNSAAIEAAYTYDLFGRPLDSTVPRSQADGDLIHTPGPVYDVNDQVVRLTDARGAVTRLRYDAGGLQTAITAPPAPGDAEEKTTRLDYDGAGNLIAETTPSGSVTTYEYDPLGRPVAATDALGAVTRTEYDAAGNPVRAIDALGNATETRYDRLGRPVETVDALGGTRKVRFDADGLPVATADEDGNWTETDHDPRGLPIEIREPVSVKDGETTWRTTRFEYDEAGNQVLHRSPRNVEAGGGEAFTTRTVYDLAGRVVEEILPYDPDDERLSEPDRMRYTYDELGRLTEISAPPSKPGGPRTLTRNTYFDNGWLKTTVDPWGIATAYEYDDNGQQRSRTVQGEGLACEGDDCPDTHRTMSWEYLPNGKVHRQSDTGVPAGLHAVVVDDHNPNSAASQGEWKTCDSRTCAAPYEGPGYATRTSDSGAFTWTLDIPADGDYDIALRNPKGRIDNAQATIQHANGTDERALDQTTGEGEWASLGRHPFNAGERYEITLDADGAGLTADAVRAVRDNSGDTKDATKSFEYRYDLDDNLTDITETSPDPYFERFHIDYDPLGRAEKVTEHPARGDPTATEFDYDALGRVIAWSQTEQSASFAYDPLGRVTEVLNEGSAVDGPQKTTTFAYDTRSFLTEQTKPNGNTVAFDFNLDGSLRHLAERRDDGRLVNEHTLAYNANGHRTEDATAVQNADDHGTTDRTTYRYEYDPRDRIREVRKSGDADGTETYEHDGNDNVIAENVDGKATAYSYDRNRLVSSTSDGIASTYRYDPFGRLSDVRLKDEPFERYVYDGFDRVSEHHALAGGEDVVTTSVYDSLDRVRAKETGGDDPVRTEHAYLGLSSQVLIDREDGELEKSYQYSPHGELLSQFTHGDEEGAGYYSFNARADVESVTDENGDNKSTYGYTAYGGDDAERFSGADDPAGGFEADPYNEYRFNTARVDIATGDYDMGFRDYDPGRNAFLTRDVYNGGLANVGLAANPFTGNQYAFGAGNPISRIEIDGHFSLSDIGHMVLDVAGMVPVIGEVADLANAGWYAAEGNYTDAALSAAGAIPFVGNAATSLKWGKNAAKGLDELGDTMKFAAKGDVPDLPKIDGPSPGKGGSTPPPKDGGGQPSPDAAAAQARAAQQQAEAAAAEAKKVQSAAQQTSGQAAQIAQRSGGDLTTVSKGSGPVSAADAASMATSARDDLLGQMQGAFSKSYLNKHRPSLVAATDTTTGNTVAAAKYGEKGGSTYCSEDLCAGALQSMNPGLSPKDIVFSGAVFPKSGNPMHYCPRCVGRYGLSN